MHAFKSIESTIGGMARFIKFSAKRQSLLDKAIDEVSLSSHLKNLKDACRTRWIQRIDSYTVFLELLPAVHTALLAMASPNQFQNLGNNSNWDAETLTRASGFLFQLEFPLFLVSFKVLLEVLTCQ